MARRTDTAPRYLLSRIGIYAPEKSVFPQRLEEGVVEPHHLGRAPPVVAQSVLPASVRSQIGLDTAVQQLPVRPPPSVDTLLHIPYGHAEVPRIHAVGYKRTEIAPLHPGCVLELVQQIVVYPAAHLLIYKRCIAAVYYIRQELRGIREQHQIVAAAVIPHSAFYVTQDAHDSQIAQNLLRGEILSKACLPVVRCHFPYQVTQTVRISLRDAASLGLACPGTPF